MKIRYFQAKRPHHSTKRDGSRFHGVYFMSNTQKIWMITGISRGLGKELARAVLLQGDVVIGTTRSGTVDLGIFGPLHVIRAALPLLRAQRSGHIVNASPLARLPPLPPSGPSPSPT